MTFLVVSACSIPQKFLSEMTRIIVAEDSNVFTSDDPQRGLRRALHIDVEICRSMEDLQAANELSDEPCDVEISNINLPEPRMAQQPGIPDRPQYPDDHLHRDFPEQLRAKLLAKDNRSIIF